jgi:tankyrase
LRNPKYEESLLQHGADPNAIFGENATTSVAPIYVATLWNSVTNVSLLLKYGADVNLKLSNGTTPLHMAIYGNSYEIALFLYHHGADPKIKDNDGVSSVDTMKRFGINGYSTHADKQAYKQLVEEFRTAGLMNSK